MWKRRYRVYTEVCDLGNIEGALEHYSRKWRQRRHLHKWQIHLAHHPSVLGAHQNSRGTSPATAEAAIQDAKRGVFERMLNAKENGVTDRPAIEYENMSDIEDWHDDEISDTLPEVIPEAFLWHVFDQLAGAVLVMHEGGNPYVGAER